MDLLGKVAIGLLTGLFVYFIYPHDKQARPITAAAFGFVGGAVGAFLSMKIHALGGPAMSPAGAATAAAGGALFTLAYLNISS